jgi:hypothetical protein
LNTFATGALLAIFLQPCKNPELSLDQPEHGAGIDTTPKTGIAVTTGFRGGEQYPYSVIAT